MKKTVLITGGNSFIAQHLIPILKMNYNVKLLTRTPKFENEYAWDLSNKTMDEAALDDVDAIVHLAGSKLNDGTPLTEERKKLVYDSRIGAADFLREKLIERHQTIDSFVSASAIGYYGFNDETFEIDENGQKGVGFAADLSEDWEKAADRFKDSSVAKHVSKIRVSLVLGKEGGIFPFYRNLVEQNPEIINQNNSSYVPWNHVEDMAGIFAYAVENSLDGVYNSVAPEPASQQQIYNAISNALKTQDIRESSPYSGHHLVSNKIQKAGYVFKFKTIQEAVEDILKD